jgi:transcriptional regulator with XRE-family HTH domain
MAKTSAGPSSSDLYDPDDIVGIFGANVKAARLKLGLSQAQLAEQSGLLRQYVSLVDLGKQNVTLVTAETIATVLGQNASDMLIRPPTRHRAKNAR